MRAPTSVAFVWLWSAVACAVYDPSILEGQPLAASGGSVSVGGSSAGGTASASGAGASASSGGNGQDSRAGAGSTGGGIAGATAGAGEAGESGGGNSGAGSGSAGSSNAGGEGGVGVAPPLGDTLLIDDMEDGNNIFFISGGGRGRWYLSNDGSAGEQTSIEQLVQFIPGGRGASERAVLTAASGFTGWGASVGFTFENTSAQRAPLDASGFSGIAFFAKVAEGSAVNVRVALPDMNTDPLGGVCENPETMSGDCRDHFGKDLTLSTEFVEYVLPWNKFAQKGWGHLVEKLDTAALLGLEVSWGNAAAEIWIDDVRFTL